MICKWMRQTACCVVTAMGAMAALLWLPGRAHADVVTEISTLSQANRLSVFHDYSIDALGISAGSIPGSAWTGGSSSIFTSVLNFPASTEPAGSGRSFEFFATPLNGYDSNPEARRAAEGGPFVGGDVGAIYHLNVGPDDATVGSPTQFRFAYDATAAAYSGTVFKADPFQQTLSGTYRRSLFHDSLFVGFMLDDQFTMLHGEAFLNTFDASPSLEWFVLPQVSLEANYDYTRLGYFIKVGDRTNTDADRHTVNTKLHFYSYPQQRGEVPESPDQLTDILRATLSRATIGYAAVFNRATGRDYIYEANRLSVGLEGVKIPRMPAMTLDATYSHEWDNYMEPSNEGPIIFAGSPKQRRRNDHVDVFTLRSNTKLLDLPRDRGSLSSFFQWDLIADRSNIEARHFNEYVISGGLTYQY